MKQKQRFRNFQSKFDNLFKALTKHEMGVRQIYKKCLFEVIKVVKYYLTVINYKLTLI